MRPSPAVLRLVAFSLLTMGLLPACNPPAEVVRGDELRLTTPGATTLVVAYSRSGHTARAARAIAEGLGADYLRVHGRGGEGDGFFSTPSSTDRVPITPRQVDLGAYRRVILATPIWYWKPSALINTFIDANDLAGKEVVLFYTNEGGLSDGAMRDWRALVEKRGGKVCDLLGVDRKKLPSGTTEADEARRLLAARREAWERCGR